MKNITILLSVFLLVNLVGCNKTEGNNINKTTINTQNITQNDKKINKEEATAQLIKAAQTGNLELAKQAIANGANINMKNYNDASCACTPITYAATYGHTDIVETLINAGAKLNSEEYSWSALTGSLAHQHFDITKKLIKAGANVNSVDEEGVTPLMSAVYQGNIEIVKDLINAGANVNAKDEYGITALMRTENKEIQKILIENGANAKNILYFPLLTACQNENIEEISNLIKQGADVNAKNVEDGKTNLIFAVEKGNTKIAKLLLDNGADVNMADYLKNTPLNIAQKNNNTEMVELLKSYGAKGNQTKNIASAEQEELNKQFLDAACANNLDLAKELVKKGANINAKHIDKNDKSIYYPILCAARNGHTNMVKFLIENNANLNVRDEEDFNSFLYAIREKNIEMAEMLLNKGAGNINDTTACWTPLHLAIESNNINTLKFVLSKGADVNQKLCTPETALEAASYNPEMVELLKSYGAKE